MSIATEISRIRSAKSAIAAAIEGKGVTVPAGTLLDGMAALIESIEAGGGGVELQYNRLYPAASGTFTPAERTEISTTSPLVIEHNAGIVPFVVRVTSNGMNAVGDLYFIASWLFPHYNANYYDHNQLYSVSARRSSSSSYHQASYGAAYPFNFTWDTKNVYVAQNNVSLYINAGKTYSWTVYGIE